MTHELIVSVTEEGVQLALLEDKYLVELHQDNAGQSFSVGDIVWANANKLLPLLNAAFVDVGHHKNGFLHYSDLGPQVRSLMNYSKLAFDGVAGNDLQNFKLEAETVKTGKINSVVTKK